MKTFRPIQEKEKGGETVKPTRPIVVLVSLFATFALLLAGWFGYERLAVEEPIRQALASVPHIHVTGVNVTPSAVVVDVQLDPDANAARTFRQLDQTLTKAAGGREVLIRVENKPSPLEEIWFRESFAVLEALEKGEYTRIPSVAAAWKERYRLDRSDVFLDERRLYIALKRDDEELVLVVPYGEAPGRREVRT